MAATVTVPNGSSPALDGPPARPPGWWDQTWKLARYQLRNYVRSRRYLLMLAIVGAIGGIVTGVLAYFRPSGLVGNSTAFYASLWGGGASVVIVFAGIIFGGDAIAGEFQNRTGYFLMGLPIRRASIYAGKYLAALAASVTAVLVYLAVLVGNGVYYFGLGAFPSPLAASLGLAIAYLLALLGATFLFSSLFKTSAYGTLVVAVLFLFVFNILAQLVEGLAKTEPWFVLSYASAVIGDVLLNPYPPHTSVGPLGGIAYVPTVPEGLAIMVGYFLLTTLGGLALFEREEFS